MSTELLVNQAPRRLAGRREVRPRTCAGRGAEGRRAALQRPATRHPEAQASQRVLDVSRDELIRSHLGLVVWIAKQYTGRGIAFTDLVSEGNTGLVRAASRWAFFQAFSTSGSLLPIVYSLMPSTLTSTASVV